MIQTLVPVKLAARRLGLSVWTVRKLAYTGAVTSVKLGSKLLIPEGELERIVAENTRPRRAAQ